MYTYANKIAKQVQWMKMKTLPKENILTTQFAKVAKMCEASITFYETQNPGGAASGAASSAAKSD